MNVFRLLQFIFLPMLLMECGVTFAADAKDKDEKQLQELNKRVDRGDYSAFLEMAKLNGKLAIPYLWPHAQYMGRSREQFNAAREALKTVHGFSDDFKKRLSDATNRQHVDIDAFKTLSVIASPEAAAVVAPYVFDFTTEHVRSSDVMPETNAMVAATMLTRMKIADAPVKDEDHLHEDLNDIVLWQKWAISHGLVPKEWNSRVGLDTFRQLDQDIFTGKIPRPKTTQEFNTALRSRFDMSKESHAPPAAQSNGKTHSAESQSTSKAQTEAELVQTALTEAKKGVTIPAAIVPSIEYKQEVAIITWTVPHPDRPPTMKDSDIYAQVTINRTSGKIVQVRLGQ